MARSYINAQQVLREDLNKLIRQPDGDTLIQDDTGSWTHTVVYRCRWNDAIGLAPRRYIDRSPDYTYLICDGVSMAREAPGIARMTVAYVGNQDNGGGGGSGGEFQPIEEMGKSTRQEPIETHRKFIDGSWDDAKLYQVGNDPPKLWNDLTTEEKKTAQFVGFSPDVEINGEKLEGRSSYLAVGGEYRRTYQQTIPPPTLLVGGIIESPPGAPDTYPDANWLVTGQNWNRRGGIYHVTETYLLSAEGSPWSDEIYG